MGLINCQQALNAEFFYHNVGAALSDSQNSSILLALSPLAPLKTLEVQESVELGGSH